MTVPFSEDVLPPSAFFHDSSKAEAASEVVEAVLEDRHSETPRAVETLLQREGELQVAMSEEERTVNAAWLRRLRHARHAAERAQQAVQQAHRRLSHAVSNSQDHVGMLIRKGGPRGGPEIPIGIVTLGFAVVMIICFADSKWGGQVVEEKKEEKNGPTSEEVPQGEPWNQDSDSDELSPRLQPLRLPNNHLTKLDLLQETAALPAGKPSKDASNKSSELHMKALQRWRKYPFNLAVVHKGPNEC